jgi:hypothetical protein
MEVQLIHDIVGYLYANVRLNMRKSSGIHSYCGYTDQTKAQHGISDAALTDVSHEVEHLA